MFNAQNKHERPGHITTQQGLSLVELMIGITLSLLISAALTTLVVNMSRAHAELDRSSRQIENGRFAVDLLAEEIKLAGYFGDVKQAGAVFSTPADPCAVNTAALGWAPSPITLPNGIEGRSGTGVIPTCVSDHVNATAILILRRLSTMAIPATAVAGGDPYVQTSHCSIDPFVPPLIISSTPADFILQNLACDTINPVRRYFNRIYYIASCSDCDSDAIPTLKRVELSGGAFVETPLAEGIQEVQYEYGFDTNADGVPDVYLTGLGAGPGTDVWSNVMAVRIWLLSRSSEATPGYTDTKTYSLGAHGVRGPYSDQFKRRVYTTMVRLNNPAGWRE